MRKQSENILDIIYILGILTVHHYLANTGLWNEEARFSLKSVSWKPTHLKSKAKINLTTVTILTSTHTSIPFLPPTFWSFLACCRWWFLLFRFQNLVLRNQSLVLYVGGNQAGVDGAQLLHMWPTRWWQFNFHEKTIFN